MLSIVLVISEPLVSKIIDYLAAFLVVAGGAFQIERALLECFEVFIGLVILERFLSTEKVSPLSEDLTLSFLMLSFFF